MTAGSSPVFTIASTSDDFVFPFGRSESEVEYSASTLYARGFYKEHVCFVPWLHTFIDWKGEERYMRRVYCERDGRVQAKLAAHVDRPLGLRRLGAGQPEAAFG
jgi:hypothetical protein